MKIAIDFDGTCVTHEYPKVGKDIGAVPVLKELIENGHKLTLFTMRSDKRGISPVTHEIENGGLQDAIDWFRVNELELTGIQEDPGQENWTSSPKCYAHLYIDDAALGAPLIWPGEGKRPYIDWNKARKMLIEQGFIKTE